MTKYFIEFGRNFANEYTIYCAQDGGKVDQAIISDKLHKAAVSPDYDFHRITRREALAATARNRKLYASGSASYCNPAGATEIKGISETGY